jgi:hypothetical protein
VQPAARAVGVGSRDSGGLLQLAARAVGVGSRDSGGLLQPATRAVGVGTVESVCAVGVGSVERASWSLQTLCGVTNNQTRKQSCKQ